MLNLKNYKEWTPQEFCNIMTVYHNITKAYVKAGVEMPSESIIFKEAVSMVECGMTAVEEDRLNPMNTKFINLRNTLWCISFGRFADLVKKEVEKAREKAEIEATQTRCYENYCK